MTMYDVNGREIRVGLVDCDVEDCTAKDDPLGYEELLIAYHHWRYHPRWCGCSHGR